MKTTSKKRSYTEAETIKILDDAIINNEELYKLNCMNWKGRAKDGARRLYTEVIAERLASDMSWNSIQEIDRKSGYLNQHKNSNNTINKDSNRHEEILAKAMRDAKIYPHLGEIIEYQMPLKDVRTDTAGKIDLVSLNGDVVYLIELKFKNTETLLRAMLEVYTYSKILKKKRFISEMNEQEKIKIKDEDIKPVVLVDSDSNCYREAVEMLCKNERPQLKKLKDLLKIKIFSYDFTAGINVSYFSEPEPIIR